MLVQTLTGSIAAALDISVVGFIWTLIRVLASTVVGAFFLAILFKYSPDAEIPWKHVWLPAILTMVILSVGAHGYGLYVETVGLSSAAGVAGTVLRVAGTVLLGLAFVYYAAQILLYGMEIVKVSCVGSVSARVAESGAAG
jgi:membrane protein